MAMNLDPNGTNDPDVLMDINTTPLIDVMLVLLVMLIITIPIQLHSVDLALPVAPPPTKTIEPEIVRIVLDADGRATWNGEALADRAALEARLRDQSLKAVPAEIHLRPDRQVRYEHVAAVLASAQRLGLKKLGIVGHEQFMP